MTPDEVARLEAELDHWKLEAEMATDAHESLARLLKGLAKASIEQVAAWRASRPLEQKTTVVQP